MVAGGGLLSQIGLSFDDESAGLMPCPICKDETATDHSPFCSRRCADVDLGRWLNGSYAVPSDDPEDTERAMEEAARDASKMH